MRLLREPMPCLQPVQVLQNTARSLPVLRYNHRPLSERNYNHFSQAVRFKSADFQRGREMRWGLLRQLTFCLVCHSQERGTLLSSLPRRSCPPETLRNSTLIQIMLAGCFSFFQGRGSLVLCIPFMPYHSLQFLFQAISDSIRIIVIHHQMILEQSNK